MLAFYSKSKKSEKGKENRYESSMNRTRKNGGGGVVEVDKRFE